MKRIFCSITMLLIFFTGFGQAKDRLALDYYNSGVTKVLEKDYTGAVADFSEAIKRDPGFIQAYENRGVAKYYLLDNTGAIADYDIALKINPEDYNTFGRRGWAKYRLHDYKGAIADFSLIIDSRPAGKYQKSQAYYWRGLLEINLGQKESACLDFSKAAKSGNRKASELLRELCR